LESSRAQSRRFGVERLSRRDLAAGLSVVRFQDTHGSLAGVSTSITVRVLPELPGAPGVPDLRRIDTARASAIERSTSR
jgi:hypothetical protein